MQEQRSTLGQLLMVVVSPMFMHMHCEGWYMWMQVAGDGEAEPCSGQEVHGNKTVWGVEPDDVCI